jgi:uncharacterized protein YecT (DUF1311 family)
MMWCAPTTASCFHKHGGMSFALALMLAQAGAAQAQPDCANAVVQQDLNFCAAQEFHAADQVLNAQWNLTAAEMRSRDERIQSREDSRPGYFDQLLAAQRAWLAYRDAHCDSEGYAARGGSMEALLVANCRTQLTIDRTEQLRVLIIGLS